MYARTISAALTPGMADEAARVFNEQVLPIIKAQPGFVSSSLMVNVEKNTAMTVTVWESEEALTSTGQGSAYLTQAIGHLRGLVVPKTFEHWDVRVSG